MPLVKDASYSTTSGGDLKLTLPTFTNLRWVEDSVEVTPDGDLEESGSCGSKTWTFENGHIIISGDVRIAAGAALPVKGHYVTDGGGKIWLVQSSSITETFACKPCLGRLELKWDEDFDAAITAGNKDITLMSSPPLDSFFTAAT